MQLNLNFLKRKKQETNINHTAILGSPNKFSPKLNFRACKYRIQYPFTQRFIVSVLAIAEVKGNLFRTYATVDISYVISSYTVCKLYLSMGDHHLPICMSTKL